MKMSKNQIYKGIFRLRANENRHFIRNVMFIHICALCIIRHHDIICYITYGRQSKPPPRAFQHGDGFVYRAAGRPCMTCALPARSTLADALNGGFQILPHAQLFAFGQAVRCKAEREPAPDSGCAYTWRTFRKLIEGMFSPDGTLRQGRNRLHRRFQFRNDRISGLRRPYRSNARPVPLRPAGNVPRRPGR